MAVHTRSNREFLRRSRRDDLPRQAEMHVLARDLDLGELVVSGGGEPGDDGLDELLGRRRASGEPDGRVAAEEIAIEIALAVDQRRRSAVKPRNLDQPLGVRAGLRADHENERRPLRDHLLDRVLTVLGRVANVVCRRAFEIAEAIAERVDGRGDVIERERRLRDHGDRLAARVEPLRILGRLDHDGRLGALAARPDHLDVVGMADERDHVAAVEVTARLGMDLRDERTDRVDNAETAALRVLLHRRGYAVGGESADLAAWNLVLVLDEDGAKGLEPADDMLVVNDLVAHVDGRPVLVEQPLDDLDRTVDARAEGPWRGQQHALAHATASRLLSARRASRA